ncbi:MAG: hypothetical protein ACKVS9_07540 [Phycisphaerae bacterium]
MNPRAYVIAALLLLASATPPHAVAQDVMPVEFATKADAYRVVKQFDFNERPLGNFEATPMYWRKLRGDGLPAFATGEFDDQIGHDAPPSFRLSIQTGNVCYEYAQLDLTVIADSDYLASAYIRASQLEHSRAFIIAYLVDRFEEKIPGSERVSNLVAATGANQEPWQRVELGIPGDFPSAYALRLQLWILHRHAWEEPGPATVDPIVRRDVRGQAWFDDVTIYRLPRARLAIDARGNIVAADAKASLLLDVNNASATTLSARVRVTDDDDRAVFEQEYRLSTAQSHIVAGASETAGGTKKSGSPKPAGVGHGEPVRVPLPELEPGLYTATLGLLADKSVMLERRLQFAVVAPLPPNSSYKPDLGVYLDDFRGHDAQAVATLMRELGIHSIKLGLPVRSAAEGELSDELRQTTELMRILGELGVECAGVISPAESSDGGSYASLREMLARDARWQATLSPLLAHFGGSLPTWQLGDERRELSGTLTWDALAIRQLRDQLKRFVSVPETVVTARINAPLAAAERGTNIVSHWIPPQIPTRDLPTVFVDAELSGDGRDWLYLDAASAGGAQGDHVDLMRRLVLSHAAAAARLYLRAPVRLTRESGSLAWEPTAAYLPLRTFVRYLSGKRLRGLMQPDEDGVILFFSGGGSSCLVTWTWRDTPHDEPVELYLGGNAQAVDMLGRMTPLSTVSGRTRIPLGREPTIIITHDTELALLQSSFRMENTYLQRHQPDPLPVITFRNPYNNNLTGEIFVQPPTSWDVAPRTFQFDVPPGEAFEKTLSFIMPPRQIASNQNCAIELRLNGPEPAKLEFSERLSLGLREIDVDCIAKWENGNLRVEQTLRNRSGSPVSFKGFCDAPGRARLDGLFVDLLPGASSTQAYILGNASNLAGATLYLGIAEIRGDRSLNQIVEVPPFSP